MNKTITCSFVLLLALTGAAFSEAPVKERGAPQAAVENANGEKAINEGTLGEFTWRGKLVDQNCKDKHIDHTCPVSPATERFGLVIDGGIIVPFDDAGNEKAKELAAKDGRKGNLEVSLVGARQGGVFKVESIRAAK